MKKPQYITIAVAVALVAVLLAFGKTAPKPKVHSVDDGHDHSQDMAAGGTNAAASGISFDSVLFEAKKRLTQEQVARINGLEAGTKETADNQDLIDRYKHLAHYWKDSAKNFLPFVWYSAEAAKLENSEKNLTFAAHLFLDGSMQQEDAGYRKWMALQAKDLFERSLKINPDNDSSKVGLGATYMFGGISNSPMAEIVKVREVAERDSTNVYAQMTLANAALMSGQTDKATARLRTVVNVQPDNIEAILMLGDIAERSEQNAEAAKWYTKALPLIKRADIRKELEDRIATLKK